MTIQELKDEYRKENKSDSNGFENDVRNELRKLNQDYQLFFNDRRDAAYLHVLGHRTILIDSHSLFCGSIFRVKRFGILSTYSFDLAEALIAAEIKP